MMKPMMQDNDWIVLEADDAVEPRLDKFVAERTDLTRSAAVRLIEGGHILVNGNPAGKNTRIATGDTVEIDLPEPEPAEAIPQDLPLDIRYEDEDLLVINKPAGMVVHPAAGNPDGTLVNALLWHRGDQLSGIGGVIRPGIVHRIDKDTSGLLVVAKNDAAHRILAEQIKEHKVSRVYYAVAIGRFRKPEGTVDAPIGRHPTDRKRMAVIRNEKIRSRSAVTHWKVLAEAQAAGNSFSYLRCELETGRTHQIRVHLASIGHPLLGDPVYGGAGTAFEAKHRDWIAGQVLHAGELTFRHPRTGEPIHVTCPPPPQMQRVLDFLFGQGSKDAF